MSTSFMKDTVAVPRGCRALRAGFPASVTRAWQGSTGRWSSFQSGQLVTGIDVRGHGGFLVATPTDSGTRGAPNARARRFRNGWPGILVSPAQRAKRRPRRLWAGCERARRALPAGGGDRRDRPGRAGHAATQHRAQPGGVPTRPPAGVSDRAHRAARCQQDAKSAPVSGSEKCSTWCP
jgi:hypothetical protein